MSDYSFYNRSELIQILMSQKSELIRQQVKTEPKDEPGKLNLKNVKTTLEAEIKAIEAELKKTATTAATSAAPANVDTSLATMATDQSMIQSMKEQAIVQNLHDVIRNVPKMVTGDSMEKFIAEMDQIYQVEVQDQVNELQKLEDEFVKATKRLLNNVMYSQMAKSGQDTSTWDNLKKYLITNHGSKITMFQHLTRLWNLEAKPEDKLTDFGAKLEEEIHTASLHIKKLYTKNHTVSGQDAVEMSADDVFKLMGAMLASIQVRNNHEDIFKAMIKKMDTHWTASSLVADAQDYVDRLGVSNNVTKTGGEIAFLAKSMNTKSADQKKSSRDKSLEEESSKAIRELQKQNEAIHQAIKSLTLTNMSSKTGGRSGLDDQKYNKAKSKVNAYKPRHEQICFKYNNGKCTGQICPEGRRHVDNYVAQAAVDACYDEGSYHEAEAEEQNNDEIPREVLDSLFQFGPDKK